MNNAQRNDYIAGCELADCTQSLAEHVARMSASAQTTEQPLAVAPPAEAAVAGGSLVAFAPGMSRQNKDDVLDSFLFATLVANKAYNPEKNSDLWYRQFNTVLATLGWLTTNWRYARYQTGQRRLSMDQAGLEIIRSAIAAAALPGPASLAMLKVAQDAVAALNSKEGALSLFERQTKTHRGGNFRLASCTESADGGLEVAMGAVAFRSRISVTNVLFWEWNNSDVEIYKGENYLTLNTRLYGDVRDVVRQRLGANAKTAIQEFDI